MHTEHVQLSRQIDPAHLDSMSNRTLSLGIDMDGRGLHWRLSATLSPEQRLAFTLAVYFKGGLYVLVDADRGFLCVERIAQQVAKLKKARGSGAYRIGHAFAGLYDALGYGHHETVGFALIERDDFACVDGFIKGFSDALAQSVEADVMHVLRGDAAAGNATLIDNLRHFINDHQSVVTVINNIM